jgi:hypothetical protein
MKGILIKNETKSIYDAAAEKGTSVHDEFERAAKALCYYQLPSLTAVFPIGRPPHRLRAIYRWYKMRKNKRRREKENG